MVPAMKRREKADRIGEILDELYPETPIPLDHTDPYTLLVAVALSAQTTDKKVNQVTPALFAVADTPEKMAALDPERILELIREIGLAPDQGQEPVDRGEPDHRRRRRGASPTGSSSNRWPVSGTRPRAS